MLRRAMGGLVVLLAAAGVALAAGGEKGDWELGVFGGYSWMDEYGAGSTADFRDLLISDNDLNPDDDAFFGLRVGYFLTTQWEFEAAFQKLSTQSMFDVCTAAPCPGTAEQAVMRDTDLTSLRLNVVYHWWEARSLRPYFTAGVGLEGTQIDSVIDEDDVSFNAGAGVRWFLTDHLSLRLEGRYVLTDVSHPVNDSQSNLESSVGFSWTFGGASPFDTDGDTVVDRKDKCPMTPRGALVDTTGCPTDADGDGVPDGLDRCVSPPGSSVGPEGCPLDGDQDGVVDPDDRCPDTPHGAHVSASGCPTDSDGDGHYDGLDRCPATPIGALVDATGCPRDDDGDGVLNGLDRCPRTPAGVPVDDRGCPLDGDGDGVHDGVDACPDTEPGVQVDRIGCPIRPVVTEEPVVLEGVQFETDSAELTPESYPILDRTAATLREWTGGHIEIVGHTDSTGDPEHNRELSRRRAETVRDYLRSRGVDDAILVTRGAGSSEPIADNSTPEGRAVNRRVELEEID